MALPKVIHPTKKIKIPSLDKVLEFESKVNYDELIDEAFKNMEKIIIEKEDFSI